MQINKDTKLYGSFSQKAGNVGCQIFNYAFQYYNINAIYKSFSITNIKNAINAALTLNFSAFAVSMPFKKEIIQYLDIVDENAQKIGAVNTVLINNGKLIGHNTDYLAGETYLSHYKDLFSKIIILGNGGYATAIDYAATTLGFSCLHLGREGMLNLQDFHKQLIFNCTPVENIKIDPSSTFIDCITSTKSGLELSKIQASHQFKLYTGQEMVWQ
jgi:shikimate 5-dehydrogenase